MNLHYNKQTNINTLPNKFTHTVSPTYQIHNSFTAVQEFEMYFIFFPCTLLSSHNVQCNTTRRCIQLVDF